MDEEREDVLDFYREFTGTELINSKLGRQIAY
jgi:hypothetical protein